LEKHQISGALSVFVGNLPTNPALFEYHTEFEYVQK